MFWPKSSSMRPDGLMRTDTGFIVCVAPTGGPVGATRLAGFSSSSSTGRHPALA